VNLWTVQNGYYQLLQTVYPKMLERRERGNALAQGWIDSFEKLGHKLAVKVG
jgi:hypothetical protein